MLLSPSAPVGSHLCPTFRALAEEVHSAFGLGRAVDLLPWETSLTNWILLTLATRFPGRIKISRFDADQEATNGADWEWWFRSGGAFAGMRVQAKRRNENGDWGLKAKAPGEPEEPQLARLIRAARSRGVTAFYCLYGDRPLKGASYNQSGPCPHGPLDPRQFAISLLLANTAERHIAKPRLSNDEVAAASFPWFRLVCNDRAGRSLVENVRWLTSHALAAEREARERVPLLPGGLLPSVDAAGGEEPPEDIRRAFDDPRSVPDLVQPDMAGVILFDDVQPG